MVFPHVLLLPLPVQGHVMPLMEMGHRLIDAGFTVTFVNTDLNHRRLLSASENGGGAFSSATNRFRLVGIPDGLRSDEERKDLGRICQAIPSSMAAHIENIIRDAVVEGRPINWMLADQNMGWALPLAKRMGLRAAAFWPASTAMIAIMFNITKMIEIGLIGEDGLPKKHEMFQLAPGMPELHTTQLGWNMAGNSAAKSAVFSFVLNNNQATADYADLLICNTFIDLEPQALSLLPSALPIGPLFAADEHPRGHLWPPANSSTILNWLDSHSPASVVYIAFGSHTIFDKDQIDELAHGLETTGRPFIWAVRPDITAEDPGEAFSPEFLKRIDGRALLVGWAPQQKLLAHPSIGCFMSHGGWNSTLEGVSNGLRFLCWPYFTDQFLNQSYICDTWRIGLRMGDDGNGSGVGGREVIHVNRDRIRERVEEVMSDDEMRRRALMWKERAVKSVSQSGTSYENFIRVLNVMKTS